MDDKENKAKLKLLKNMGFQDLQTIKSNIKKFNEKELTKSKLNEKNNYNTEKLVINLNNFNTETTGSIEESNNHASYTGNINKNNIESKVIHFNLGKENGKNINFIEQDLETENSPKLRIRNFSQYNRNPRNKGNINLGSLLNVDSPRALQQELARKNEKLNLKNCIDIGSSNSANDKSGDKQKKIGFSKLDNNDIDKNFISKGFNTNTEESLSGEEIFKVPNTSRNVANFDKNKGDLNVNIGNMNQNKNNIKKTSELDNLIGHISKTPIYKPGKIKFSMEKLNEIPRFIVAGGKIPKKMSDANDSINRNIIDTGNINNYNNSNNNGNNTSNKSNSNSNSHNNNVNINLYGNNNKNNIIAPVNISYLKESDPSNAEEIKKNYVNKQVIPRMSLININAKLGEFDCDNFKIISKIGEGSYGQIYHVEDKFNRNYCMKKIVSSESKDLNIFAQEYEIVNRIRHENVLRIYSICRRKLDNTTYVLYILMEKAVTDWDKEIKARAAQKKFYCEEDLLFILKQCVEALCFLQQNNIAHRDIKPQNILIFKDGIFKIADFGEAKKIKNEQLINKKLNTLRGTELYMSPTLFEALNKNLDDIKHDPYKSDVFSLGLCFVYGATLNINNLFEIREIFDSNYLKNKIKKLLKPSYSDFFIEMIELMLELNEDKRYDFIHLQKLLVKNGI